MFSFSFYYFHYTIALKCGFVYNLIISAFSLFWCFWKFSKPCQLHIFSSGSRSSNHKMAYLGIHLLNFVSWGPKIVCYCHVLFFVHLFYVYFFQCVRRKCFFVVASFTFYIFSVIFMFYFSVWFVMVWFYVCLYEWLVIVFSRHLQVCVLCICVGVSEFIYS